MSAQPALDFGVQLAPTIPSAPVHSANGDVPGEGKHLVKCERCKRLRMRRREARFCSDFCKDAHRHDKQAAIEQGKKHRGMKGSAAKNSEFLEIARESARRVLARDGDVDADRVRFELEARGLVLPSGGWWGSLFAGDEWTWTGKLVACKHKGSRARQIKLWRKYGIGDYRPEKGGGFGRFRVE